MAGDLFTTRPPEARVRIRYGASEHQFGELRLPGRPGPHPVVVVVHGGFWRAAYDLEHIGHACHALTNALDVATWSLEYRRIGHEGGGWPNTFLDVAAGTDHLAPFAEQYSLDLSRVVVTGHSAGGHLASWLASRHRIPEDDPLYLSSPLRANAAVPLAGVLDLRLGWEMNLSRGVVRDFMGAIPDEAPGRYATASPVEMVPTGVPHILVHGTDDENVPYLISECYRDAALAAGDDCRLVTLPGAGHFELIDPRSREWKQVVEAISAALNA